MLPPQRPQTARWGPGLRPGSERRSYAVDLARLVGDAGDIRCTALNVRALVTTRTRSRKTRVNRVGHFPAALRRSAWDTRRHPASVSAVESESACRTVRCRYAATAAGPPAGGPREPGRRTAQPETGRSDSSRRLPSMCSGGRSQRRRFEPAAEDVTNQPLVDVGASGSERSLVSRPQRPRPLAGGPVAGVT
jgi:hypothetical protein